MPMVSLSDRLTADSHARTMARKYVWWQPPEATLADAAIFSGATHDDRHGRRRSLAAFGSFRRRPAQCAPRTSGGHFQRSFLVVLASPARLRGRSRPSGQALAAVMLEPILAALSDEQRRLWPALADVPDSFVLCGGTALAAAAGTSVLGRLPLLLVLAARSRHGARDSLCRLCRSPSARAYGADAVGDVERRAREGVVLRRHRHRPSGRSRSDRKTRFSGSPHCWTCSERS